VWAHGSARGSSHTSSSEHSPRPTTSSWAGARRSSRSFSLLNGLASRVVVVYRCGMAFTIIDSCTGCSACERRCPTAAIHGVKKEMYYIDPNLCIDCGACGAVCPDEAILDGNGVLTQQLKAQERPKAFVQLEKCTGCGYCVNAC